MKVEINCGYCGKPFTAPHWRNRRFCSQNCGAHVSKKRAHNLTDSVEHRIWAGMRRRCNSPQRHNYRYYGGRGIKVCQRWDDFNNFLADMGHRPEGYTLDRIDSDGDYEPSNCKWSTALEQNRNRSISYTDKDNSKIREAIAAGKNFTEIAALFPERTAKGVVSHAYRIGLSSGQPVRKISDRRTSELSSQHHHTGE